MTEGLPYHQYQEALAALDSSDASRSDKIDMLMEIAMGLQQKPESPQQLLDAVALYDRALGLCREGEALAVARLNARKATALNAVPAMDTGFLEQARDCLVASIDVLRNEGTDAETAEAEMNLGLVLHGLSAHHKAKISDAIAAYQRALRVFNKQDYASEYAILHNNLATAFLSVPVTDERGKMREALAVQSFESALEVITLVDQPTEYAMLQNNLGNALQYASSSHGVANNLRALEAYDEALKVRTLQDTPLEYANTISNKANCLRNLPDDVADPRLGNKSRLSQAQNLYRDAAEIFEHYGEQQKAQLIAEILQEISSELKDNNANGFGESLI